MQELERETILRSVYASTSLLVVVITAIAIGAIFLGNQVSTAAPPNSSTGATSVLSGPILVCDNRVFVQNIVSMVENNPKVVSAASQSSKWVLTYAGNETGYSANLTTTVHTSDTELVFYSFATSFNGNCNWSGKVSFAMFVHVPINGDGTYALNKLTAYSEPYNSNGTNISTK